MGPPHRETASLTGWLCGGRAVLPEEVRAKPGPGLESPMKPLIPQMQAWELGKGVYSLSPLILHCQGLGLLMGTKGQGA